MKSPSTWAFVLLAVAHGVLAYTQALANRPVLALVLALNGITIAIVALVRKERA